MEQRGEVGDGAEGEVEVAKLREVTEAGTLDFGLTEGKFAEVGKTFYCVEARFFEADAVEEVIGERQLFEGVGGGEKAELGAEVLAAIGVAIPEGAGEAEFAEGAEADHTFEIFGDGVDGDPIDHVDLIVGGGEVGDVRDETAGDGDAAALEKGPAGKGLVGGGGVGGQREKEHADLDQPTH